MNYKVTTADGEVWKCSYDPGFGGYYWEAQPDPATSYAATSAVGNIADPYANVGSESVTEAQGIRINSGSDVFVDGPSLPSGEIGARAILYHYNGTSWDLIRDSGYTYNTGWASQLTPTFFWGDHPAGAGYYGTWAYGSVYTLDGFWESGQVWSGTVNCAGAGAAATKSVTKPPAPPPAPHIMPPPRPRAPLLVGF